MFSILSAVTGFLYPAYSSYKTLAKRPVEEAELERWVMYWSVLASLLTIEYIVPFISWIPFYSLLRFVFVLYLVLPQVQGSTYIYKVHLQPFLSLHEQEIDTLLERGKARLWEEGRKWTNIIWEKVLGSLGASQAAATSAGAGTSAGSGQAPGGGMPVPPDHPIGAAQPPSLAYPLSGPAQMLGGLWRTYGPSLIAGGAAFIQSQQANLASRSGAAVSDPTRQRTAADASSGATSGISARSQDAQAQSNLARRRQTGEVTESGSGSVESSPSGSSGPAFPVPQLPLPTPVPGQHGSPEFPSPLHTPSTSYSGDEREKRYETISHEEADEHEERPNLPQRGSWFPWSPGSKGYERVKSE